MRFFPVEHTDWSLRRKIKVGPNSNADDPRLRDVAHLELEDILDIGLGTTIVPETAFKKNNTGTRGALRLTRAYYSTLTKILLKLRVREFV